MVGTASFNAGANRIDLPFLENDFQGQVNLTSSGSFTHALTDRNDLVLGTMSLHATGSALQLQTGTGGLTLPGAATGHLTQTSPITTREIQLTTYGQVSDILLDQANQLSGSTPFLLTASALPVSTWRHVSLRNDVSVGGTLVLDPNGTWTAIDGNLTVRTVDNIGQLNPLTVVGTASFNAGANAVDLPFLLNDFQGSVAVPSASSVTLYDQNVLTLGSIGATGAVLAEAVTNLNIAGGATISTTAGGNSIVLVAGNNFVNSAGTGALSATSGRWLVYSTSPAGSTENGLTTAAGSTLPRLYNRTYAGNPPAGIAAGNHLVYSSQPTLTVTADDASRAYGAANPAFTFTSTGFVSDDGVTDNATSAGLSGAPSVTSAAAPASPVSGSPYAITPSTGTYASAAGYGFSYTAGNLTVTPVPLTVTADNQSRLVGDPNPAFTASFSGFVLGEGQGNLGGVLAFSTPANAGSPAGSYPITPSGLTSGNYTISFVNGSLQVTSLTPPVVAVVAPPENRDLIVATERIQRLDEREIPVETRIACRRIAFNLYDCR